jgi:hypothetical protein
VATETPFTDRGVMAAARAAGLRARSQQLIDAASERVMMIERGRLLAGELRRHSVRSLHRGHVVSVTGTIEGRGATVVWTDGDLEGDPEMIKRAELLVSMGERWRTEDLGIDGPNTTLSASLAGPLIAVALTLMRSCTTVQSVVVPSVTTPA